MYQLDAFEKQLNARVYDMDLKDQDYEQMVHLINQAKQQILKQDAPTEAIA